MTAHRYTHRWYPTVISDIPADICVCGVLRNMDGSNDTAICSSRLTESKEKSMIKSINVRTIDPDIAIYLIDRIRGHIRVLEDYKFNTLTEGDLVAKHFRSAYEMGLIGDENKFTLGEIWLGVRAYMDVVALMVPNKESGTGNTGFVFSRVDLGKGLFTYECSVHGSTPVSHYSLPLAMLHAVWNVWLDSLEERVAETEKVT